MHNINISRVQFRLETKPFDEIPKEFINQMVKKFTVSPFSDGYMFRYEDDLLILDTDGHIILSFRKEGGTEIDYYETIQSYLSMVEFAVSDLENMALSAYYCVELKEQAKYSSKDLVNIKNLPTDKLHKNFDSSIKLKLNEANIIIDCDFFNKTDDHIHFTISFATKDPSFNIKEDLKNKFLELKSNINIIVKALA